jgi:hypothetical protein
MVPQLPRRQRSQETESNSMPYSSYFIDYFIDPEKDNSSYLNGRENNIDERATEYI